MKIIIGIAMMAATLFACAAAETEPIHEENTDMPVETSGEFSDPVIHIGVVVSDLERAVTFYTNVIGMKEVGGFEIDSEFGKSSGLTGDLPFSVKTLKLEDSDSATQWKLMTFGGNDGKGRYKFIQDDIGLQYITIMVNDLKPFVGRIEAAGVPLLGDTPIELGDAGSFVLIQDPDGTFIELIGPMSG